MQHFHSEPEPQSVYTDATASPLNTGAPTDTFDATEQRRLQESIEDYLDRVCRPLMDTLPYAARQELRREIAQHLNALVQAYRESGYAPVLATEKALDKFGPPHLVAQKWNPVTAREGQSKRIERWLTGQWQGIAATLVLCSAAGVLGLILHQSGALVPRRLMPRSQPAVVSVATPATPIRPLTYTAMVGEQDIPAYWAWHQNALDQASAELMHARAQLAEQQAAIQLVNLYNARTLTAITAARDSERLRRDAQVRQSALEEQRMSVQQMERQVEVQKALLAEAAARLEFTKSQRGHRNL